MSLCLYCICGASELWVTKLRRSAIVSPSSGLKLAVTADRDLRGGGARPPVLGAGAIIAGLWAAWVAGGGSQQVGMVALLDGTLRGASGGQMGGVLLKSV